MTTRIVVGIDLGGTAINYTFLDEHGKFLIEGLCEHPARSVEGPEVCLNQIADGLKIAAKQAKIKLTNIVAAGLDTPGPASAKGVLSTRGATNFVHPKWAGFDLRSGVEQTINLPVTYLNDGNAAALWGHVSLFGADSKSTSISAIVGTGLGGGVIVQDQVVVGRNGFGGELGHIMLPIHLIKGIEGLAPVCNCKRVADVESLCSLTAIKQALLPFFLKRNPDHPLAKESDISKAAKQVRGMAEKGDALCLEIFRVQANALGLFFDQMLNVFDPDALIVGGGAVETSKKFQAWFISEIRAVMALPGQRDEQKNIDIHVMPNGDTAGSRGAALEALRMIQGTW